MIQILQDNTADLTDFLEAGQQLAALARKLGFVITIENQPLQPLAARHYESVVDVREFRGNAPATECTWTPDIQTHAGHYFDFLEPSKSVLSIETIAHALSNLCRFTGHTRWFYSVAQHSVLVSYALPPELALQGLLHDIAESVLGDVSSPLKALLRDYKVIERRVERELFPRFGLPMKLHPMVKRADLVLLATERRDLMPPPGDGSWSIIADVPPLRHIISPVGPEEAKAMFLGRYLELTT